WARLTCVAPIGTSWDNDRSIQTRAEWSIPAAQFKPDGFAHSTIDNPQIKARIGTLRSEAFSSTAGGLDDFRRDERGRPLVHARPATPSFSPLVGRRARPQKPSRYAEQEDSLPAHPRQPAQLRAISLERSVVKYAEGSCFVKFGDTHVLVTATLEDRLPPWLKGQARGWVTAEYGMLPRATSERTRREASAGKQSGRTI